MTPHSFTIDYTIVWIVIGMYVGGFIFLCSCSLYLMYRERKHENKQANIYAGPVESDSKYPPYIRVVK